MLNSDEINTLRLGLVAVLSEDYRQTHNFNNPDVMPLKVVLATLEYVAGASDATQQFFFDKIIEAGKVALATDDGKELQKRIKEVDNLHITEKIKSPDSKIGIVSFDEHFVFDEPEEKNEIPEPKTRRGRIRNPQ